MAYTVSLANRDNLLFQQRLNYKVSLTTVREYEIENRHYRELFYFEEDPVRRQEWEALQECRLTTSGKHCKDAGSPHTQKQKLEQTGLN